MAKWKDKAAKAKHQQNQQQQQNNNNENNQQKKDKKQQLDTIRLPAGSPQLQKGDILVGNGDNTEEIIGIYVSEVPVQYTEKLYFVETMVSHGAHKGARRRIPYPEGADVRVLKTDNHKRRERRAAVTGWMNWFRSIMTLGLL